jgi:addiction module HigA family antidote
MLDHNNNPPVGPPPHPGLILKKDFIDPLGISVTELSAKLGVSRNTLSSIINRRSGISADMALRFSRAFKNQPEFWLKLKFAYELWEAKQFDSGWREVEPLKMPKTSNFSRPQTRTTRRTKRLPRSNK